MKKWSAYLEICGVILILILSVSLFAWSNEEEKVLDPISREVVKLQKDLALDTTQTLKVREIVEKKHAQATKDREQFKLSALQLLQSARTRKEIANSAIIAILTPQQQETFTRLQKMTPIDRELTMWTEGLLLNDDQAFTVEGILIDFYNRIEEMMPEGMPPMDGEKPAMDMGMGRGGFGGPGGMMREMLSSKISKIRKILSPEQIILLKQIRDDLKKKMKENRQNPKLPRVRHFLFRL